MSTNIIPDSGMPSRREYYLDWIRNGVVLILIPFHAAVTFSHIGKGYVYTPRPADSWFYIFLSDFFNLWIMRLLFFVSGISASFSLKKRTNRDFVLYRFKRLILPVLFLIFTLGPLSGYILAVGRDAFSRSFLNFYPLFFSQPKKYLFWGHMWYCVYLFIFSLVYLPLLSYLKKRPAVTDGIGRFLTKGNRIFLPMLIVIFFEVILRPFYPGYQSFAGDWANVAVYSVFFLLGFIMARNPEVFDRIVKNRGVFLVAAVISTLLYLYCKRFLFADESYGHLAVLSALWGTAAYTWVFSLTGILKKRANRSSAPLAYLSRTSFSLYLFHYLILSLLNYIFLKTSLPYFAVWLITTLGTYLIFAFLFEFLLKKTRFIAYICGIPYKTRV